MLSGQYNLVSALQDMPVLQAYIPPWQPTVIYGGQVFALQHMFVTSLERPNIFHTSEYDKVKYLATAITSHYTYDMDSHM